MLTQSWRSKSAVFRMYCPLTLNGYSNFINAIKRQRNLGLLISIMSFKLGHVSIPKRHIFLFLFLFCAYDSSVLQNFKIFTHLLPNFSYKDPRLTEVTYLCINLNDRVRKVPKMYYLNVWNVSDPIVEVNAVVRHFRQPWVLIRKIWQ